MNKPNLMTQITHERLLKDLQKATESEEKAHKAIGAAAGAETDWHDNAAFDYAQMQYDLALANLNEVKNKLNDYKIILPRKETDVVAVGNTVILEFKASKEKKKFTILGPEDSVTKEEWISVETPLAQSILNKKAGRTGKIKLAEYTEEVKVIEILEGDF